MTIPARYRLLVALAVLAAIAHPTGAFADDGSDRSTFSFSSFGTAGLVHSSDDQADFAGNQLQLNGAGYTREWSAGVDSKLGVQAIANLSSQLSAVLQLISEQNDDGTYRPHVEWANLKYQPTSDATIRVGRILLATFLFSDSRKVGYANPWLRPPVELYSLWPISNNDGVDASYRAHLGRLINTVGGTYGKAHVSVPGGGKLNSSHGWLVTDTVEAGSATVHIGYQQTTYSLHLSNFDALFEALRQFGPKGVALADKYNADGKIVRNFTVGASYNPGNWFAMGEWGRRKSQSALGDITAWYVSGGYALRKVTPYVSYGQVFANSKTSDPGLDPATFPVYLAGSVAALNAGLDAVLGAVAVQDTISAGTRWDVMKNVDIKLQYDHIGLGAGSSGLLINAQPGLQRGGTLNVFSAAVDFVF